jgi:hypothetical protein
MNLANFHATAERVPERGLQPVSILVHLEAGRGDTGADQDRR